MDWQFNNKKWLGKNSKQLCVSKLTFSELKLFQNEKQFENLDRPKLNEKDHGCLCAKFNFLVHNSQCKNVSLL